MSEEDIELALAPRSLTLTDFLLARIAEREKLAEANHDLLCLRIGCESCVFDDDPVAIAQERVCTCGLPARVLAECQAVRRIVEGMQPYGEFDDMFAPEILGTLAAVYADHPDYRDEWRA